LKTRLTEVVRLARRSDARLQVAHLTSGRHYVLPASTHLFAALSRPIDRRETAMRNKTVAGIALLVLAQGVARCSGTDSSSTPLGPSPVAPQAAPPPPRSAGSWLAGYTLTGVSISGVVYESKPTGRVPNRGARVYCELCGTETHTFMTADASGSHVFQETSRVVAACGCLADLRPSLSKQRLPRPRWTPTLL
jgi:hypothetical protein